MRKIKTKSVEAKVIGVIPRPVGRTAFWYVRMKAPRFPFFIDSDVCFMTAAEAEAEAEKWKRRKVVVHVRSK